MAETRDHLLGVDAGNTVVKAVLFDLDGRQVACRSLRRRSSSPEPARVERDLDELWANARAVIRGCIADFGTDPARIAGIGCTGHGNGLYLLDADGRLLLGIQSLDTRAADLARGLSDRCGDALHSLCLQKPWPAQTAVLLAWVKRRRPDLYRMAETVLFCKDLVTYRLTGRRVSEITDMSAGGLLRMPECAFDDSLLELYGLADLREKLPELHGPSDLAGHVTHGSGCGLAAGTPVSAGCIDVVACALGSGVSRPGQASIILGTWSINQVLSREPVFDPDMFMAVGCGPCCFANIEASATSAANLEWYVQTFLDRPDDGGAPFDLANECAARAEPAPDDPYFHPFLFGSGQGPEFRAGFYGLTGWHDQRHLLRALFEGVAFEHRRHVEVLTASGIVIDRAVLSGGGCRSPVWPQLMSDVLGIPLAVTDCEETGALGAAMGAGVAAGVFADHEAATAAMTRERKLFRPRMSMRSHYDNRYRTYLSLTEAMLGYWNAQHRLVADGPGRAAVPTGPEQIRQAGRVW